MPRPMRGAIRMAPAYCIVLLLAISSLGTGAQQPVSPSATFTIFLQGRVIGTEQVVVNEEAGGRVIGGSSRLGPPIDLAIKKAEIRYGVDWTPLQAVIEGTFRTSALSIRTKFANDTAASEIVDGAQTSTKADPVAPDTLVLPHLFFGSNEALAARLMHAQPGTTLRAYILPDREINVRLDRAVDERIQLPDRTIEARRFELTTERPDGLFPVLLWADRGGRLLRLQFPSQSLEYVRNDVGSVLARRETISHPGDEQVRVPSTGFSLAATLTKPTATPSGRSALGAGRSATPEPGAESPEPRRRWPAVALVGGQAVIDRDGTIAGIPVLGQLANALADSGFLAVRYDKRGMGQSGGRAESATLTDYAEDLRAVVKYLRDRKDVDRQRITVVGHGEGGWIALLAASKERKRISAVVLVSTAGVPGSELVLEQQRLLLERMKSSEAEKKDRIDLQQRINQAVISGKGWETIAEPVRRQADTPWFQSFLLFDPARIIRDVRQRILILHGALDSQVSAGHAERLAELARRRTARGRKKPDGEATVVTVPGANHLLVPATTGEIDEYTSLKDRSVSPEVLAALRGWLNKTFGENPIREPRDSLGLRPRDVDPSVRCGS